MWNRLNSRGLCFDWKNAPKCLSIWFWWIEMHEQQMAVKISEIKSMGGKIVEWADDWEKINIISVCNCLLALNLIEVSYTTELFYFRSFASSFWPKFTERVLYLHIPYFVFISMWNAWHSCVKNSSWYGL